MSPRIWIAAGIGAAFLALAATAGVLKLQLDAATARAELALERQVAAEGSLKAYKEADDKFAQLDARLSAFDKKLDAKKPAIIREILNAPASDNAPIAPVLLRTLDRLRELCDEAGPNTCTPAPAAGEPDSVRDQPAPADDDAGRIGPVAGD